jgi:nucleotide-binding universal stress UspA family protein
MNIQTILSPTDFSDDSRHALDHAAAIARWYSARVVVLHASPAMKDVPMLVGAGGGIDDFDTSRARASSMRKEIAAWSANAGVDVSADVAEGPAAAAIVEYAAHNAIDLIVIGTHGVGGFEHLVLGSVTEKVLRRSSRPVLTVPPRARVTSSLPFKRIICPSDFSSSSLAALEAALSLAKEGDAALTLLHVLEDPDEHELFVPRAYDVHHHRELREHHVAQHLASLVPDSAREWASPRVRVAAGKPYQEILRVADEDRADLIVMGVQGRSPVDLMMFGSTTNQVIRRATCPVLTIRQ